MAGQIEFIKMHGIGNDFVVIDVRSTSSAGLVKFSSEQIQHICDRHKGIGCDQFVLIEDAQKEGADCFVRFYNPDGSESGACGNATRCIAQIIMNEKNSDNAKLQTQAGILDVARAGDDISVNMGVYKMNWQEVPLARKHDCLSVPIIPSVTKESSSFDEAVCVNVGNPHAVFFVDDAKSVDLQNIGAKLENHEIFPERANISIVQVVADDEIILRVFERGAGETLACGSGACAAVVASYLKGHTGNNVKVRLAGGDLNIKIRDDKSVIMTGAAQESFRGVVNL